MFKFNTHELKSLWGPCSLERKVLLLQLFTSQLNSRQHTSPKNISKIPSLTITQKDERKKNFHTFLPVWKMRCLLCAITSAWLCYNQRASRANDYRKILSKLTTLNPLPQGAHFRALNPIADKRQQILASAHIHCDLDGKHICCTETQIMQNKKAKKKKIWMGTTISSH